MKLDKQSQMQAVSGGVCDAFGTMLDAMGGYPMTRSDLIDAVGEGAKQAFAQVLAIDGGYPNSRRELLDVVAEAVKAGTIQASPDLRAENQLLRGIVRKQHFEQRRKAGQRVPLQSIAYSTAEIILLGECVEGDDHEPT